MKCENTLQSTFRNNNKIFIMLNVVSEIKLNHILTYYINLSFRNLS